MCMDNECHELVYKKLWPNKSKMLRNVLYQLLLEFTDLASMSILSTSLIHDLASARVH